MKKLLDIQISATPNARQSTVKIDGVDVPRMTKLTLIVECNQPTRLILEGLCTDHEGRVEIEMVDGQVSTKTFTKEFFGGSVRIQGAAPDERQHP